MFVEMILKLKNLHVIIIDLNDVKKHRIITLYHSFNPQTPLTQKQFFEAQLQTLQSNITKILLFLVTLTLMNENALITTTVISFTLKHEKPPMILKT